MERTISEKHLFTIGKKQGQIRIDVTVREPFNISNEAHFEHQQFVVHTNQQTQDNFMYGTIRKIPQKGTVRILADKYDKCLRLPLIIPKPADVPKSPECFFNRTVSSKFSRKLSLPSNDDGGKMVEKFHTARVNRLKEPRVPVNGSRLFMNSETCYSLESNPPERKEGSSLSSL